MTRKKKSTGREPDDADGASKEADESQLIDPELTYDPDIPVGALLAFMVDKWRLHIPLDTTWRAFLIEHRSDLNIRVDQDLLKLQKSKALWNDTLHINIDGVYEEAFVDRTAKEAIKYLGKEEKQLTDFKVLLNSL